MKRKQTMFICPDEHVEFYKQKGEEVKGLSDLSPITKVMAGKIYPVHGDPYKFADVENIPTSSNGSFIAIVALENGDVCDYQGSCSPSGLRELTTEKENLYMRFGIYYPAAKS